MSARHRPSCSICSPARWSASRPRSRSRQPSTRTGSTEGWVSRKRWRASAAEPRGWQARVTKCLDEETGEAADHEEPRASSWRTSSVAARITPAARASSFLSGGRSGLSVSEDANLAAGDTNAEHVDTYRPKGGPGADVEPGRATRHEGVLVRPGAGAGQAADPCGLRGVRGGARRERPSPWCVNDFGIIAACVQWRGKLEDMAPTGCPDRPALKSFRLRGALVWTAPAIATLSGVPEATPVRSATDTHHRRGRHHRRARGRVDAPIRAGPADEGQHHRHVGQCGGGPADGVRGGGRIQHGDAASSPRSVVTGIIVFKMGDLPIRLGLDREVTKRLLISVHRWRSAWVSKPCC